VERPATAADTRLRKKEIKELIKKYLQKQKEKENGTYNCDFMVHAVVTAGSQLHTGRLTADDKCESEDNTGSTEQPCTVNADIEQLQYECNYTDKEYHRRVERPATSADT
jgi:hypothetical protein